ncbi:MAG: hypothetical protein KDK39_16975 [Leptospiraceae bacterium]|nr:hypothetical protein [Leptospiraceae bacterium]
MIANYLAVSGGIFSIGLALFHIGFWRIFNWGKTLPRMNKMDRAVMQVMNLCLIVLFSSMAGLYFYFGGSLSDNAAGRAILILFAIFWGFRALIQIPYFGGSALSWAFVGIFTIGFVIPAAMLYLA